MTTKQRRIGGLDAALLGAGNRMAGHEARRHVPERLTCSPHHIAFGAADVGQDCMTQIDRRQQPKQLFHGQYRHRQLNHVRATASGGKVSLTTVHDPQLDRQLSRLRIEVDADHLATQAAFAHTLGKGTTDQPQSDDHQTTDHRPYRRLCNHINHANTPDSPAR